MSTPREFSARLFLYRNKILLLPIFVDKHPVPPISLFLELDNEAGQVKTSNKFGDVLLLRFPDVFSTQFVGDWRLIP